MSGISVVDRRDLERAIKAQLYALKRDDVKVEVLYYVNLSITEEIGVNLLVDPYQPLVRSRVRSLVAEATKRMDGEEQAKAKVVDAKQVIGAISEDSPPADNSAGSESVVGVPEEEPVAETAVVPAGAVSYTLKFPPKEAGL